MPRICGVPAELQRHFFNHQDARNNNQTIFNFQYSNSKFWLLIIGICDLFVSCFLVIGLLIAVGREGFEPPKAEADRFTVCCD